MKFCHVLETTSHDNPEYRRLFLFYKQMKKQLKRLPAAGSDASSEAILASEARFVEILVQQISALNNFRMERQAQCVRTLSDLRGRMHDSVGNLEERQQIYQAVVNFHGQALLLMHYSILAYTAIVKLLKKHHKRTGILLQAPHLRDVLSQPAWSTEVVTGLISQAEVAVRQLQGELFGSGGAGQEAVGPQRAGSTASVVDNQVLLNTLAAIANNDVDDPEDSGEDSMLDGAASEEGDMEYDDGGGSAEGSASVCSNAQQSSGRAAGSSGGAGSAAGGSVSGNSHDPAGAPVPRLVGGAAGAAEGSEPFANRMLVSQMEAALRTWEYLQTHASTPSTVLRQ